MKGLSKRQSEILEFLRSHIQKCGYSPSYREIMKYFKFKSLATVSCHLKALQKKGFITYQKQSSRSIGLTESEKSSSSLTLSFIGTIALGKPLELFQDIKTMTVPRELVPHPEDSYILRAKGDELKEELIDDGDLLIIETKENGLHGETILASIDGLPFVRKIYVKEENIELRSRGRDIDPIIINPSLVQIQGSLVALIRVF